MQFITVVDVLVIMHWRLRSEQVETLQVQFITVVDVPVIMHRRLRSQDGGDAAGAGYHGG